MASASSRKPALSRASPPRPRPHRLSHLDQRKSGFSQQQVHGIAVSRLTAVVPPDMARLKPLPLSLSTTPDSRLLVDIYPNENHDIWQSTACLSSLANPL
jgi:hypothetical protein